MQILNVVNLEDSPELIPLLFLVIRSFQSKDAQTLIVDLGQSLRIPCPPHGESPGAVYSWYGTVNAEFKRNSRRAILPAGDLFIMFVTDEDIFKIEQLKGIRCTMTGADTIYQSGPITLRKRIPGNDLLYFILHCLTVVCSGIRNEPDSGTSVQIVGPIILQVYRSLFQNIIYTAGKSFSFAIGHDFANEILLLCQFDV